MTRLGAALFGLILLAAGPGCVSVVPYTPKTSLIEELGYEGAQDRFAVLMNGARSPRIGTASIDTKKFEFELSGGHAGWWWGWGQPGSHPVVYLENIGRLDIYENNKVFVIAPDERKMTEFLFGSQGDCFVFADLVYSFKTYQGPVPEKGTGGGSGGGNDAGANDRKSSNVMDGDQKGADSGGGGDGDQKQKNVLGDD